MLAAATTDPRRAALVRVPVLAGRLGLCRIRDITEHQGASGIKIGDGGIRGPGLISGSQAQLSAQGTSGISGISRDIRNQDQGYQESGSGMGVSGSLPDLPDSTQESDPKARSALRI